MCLQSQHLDYRSLKNKHPSATVTETQVKVSQDRGLDAAGVDAALKALGCQGAAAASVPNPKQLLQGGCSTTAASD
eukprot:3119591-Amphidinium_carterae.1